MAYRRTPEIELRMQQRRSEIVTAARTLLAAQGYAATTMQAVAVAAGTSVGNLYFHYEDKDAVVQAVVDEIVREIGARADRAESMVPRGRAQIAAATYAGVRVVLENRLLCQRVLAEPGTHAVRARVLEAFVQRFRGRLKADRGLGRGVELDLLAQATQGAMFHVLEHALLGPTRHSCKKLARFLSAFSLRALGDDAAEVERVVSEVEHILTQKSKSIRRPHTRNQEASR